MVRFEYPSAEMGSEGTVIGKRIIAFAIDSILIVVGVGAIIVLLRVISPPFLPGLQRLFGVVLVFGYFIYLEGKYGQTIGKMLMKVVVVTEDGEEIDYVKAAGRTFLRPIDGIFFIGLFSILASDRHQRPSDMSADTVVLRNCNPPSRLAGRVTFQRRCGNCYWIRRDSASVRGSTPAFHHTFSVTVLRPTR